MNKRYTVIDGIPTINPISPATRKPIAISEAELDARIADLDAMLKEWYTQRQTRGELKPKPTVLYP